MEYVPGTDAAGLALALGGPLPIPRAVDLACQTLNALAYAHARKFVHRDIKPHNLLVTQVDGRDLVKVTDFGLARIYHASMLSGLSFAGQFSGSLGYLPPEQITNYRDSGPSADLYAVGATLYYLLTGRSIYDFPMTFEKRLLMILEQNPVPITSRRTDIPPGLGAVVHRALARAETPILRRRGDARGLDPLAMTCGQAPTRGPLILGGRPSSCRPYLPPRGCTAWRPRSSSFHQRRPKRDSGHWG